ncbi:LysR family transcriptional regulator [Alteromonas sp. KUL49]|uniref:LysR family transcriptional regulator n=1 Tax=Alteromonas sp. KUL49 TaxID=2480798 RepID=UPI0010FFB418|nr:LysR family transcriptional regulator [Alteromonas sp. KUL49]GEA11249.1 transcriptional regulator [Alteromonas sp. KUL49]
MINELKAMAIFAEVVKLGSFKAAATSLNLSPSVVSYHIAKLEENTGSALLYRSTRNVSLSSEGERFYQHVKNMLNAAQQGMALLSSQQSQPFGKLKITMPTALSRSSLNDRIADFALAYPKIELHIDYSDTRSRIIDEGVDITIRAGALEDSDLKSTKIGEIKRLLVCTPELYRKHSKPVKPKDLTCWNWIKLQQLSNSRVFVREGQRQTLVFNSQIEVNSVEAIYQFCLKGLGLAVLSDSQVINELDTGRLIHVLKGWNIEPLTLSAVWPKNIQPGSNAKLLLDYLKGY